MKFLTKLLVSVCVFFLMSTSCFAALIGYYDDEHTKDDGYQQSLIDYWPGISYGFGVSVRYNKGAADLGRTAWGYDISNAKQHKLGYYDAEHTKSDGCKYSSIDTITQKEYLSGYSERYNGGAVFLGRTAWGYNMANATQQKVGYYDAEHTKDDGYKYSQVYEVSGDGYLSGYSKRYSGGAVDLGRTAWGYNMLNATQQKVGYYDAEHTRDDGYKYSLIDIMSESGYAGGCSSRYNGGNTYLGNTAWVYDIPNTTLHKAGYYDAEHTRNDGYQSSNPSNINESGCFVGYSRRYNGGAADLGRTAWMYDIQNATHYKLGYYDAEHTRNDGYQQSSSLYITDSGYVGGYSNRSNGGAVDLGRTVWVYDIPNSMHHKVGYYDAEHTKDNGYKISYIEDLTESGYVRGYSSRYNGGAVDLGRTTWVYDIPNTTHHKVGYYDAEHSKDNGHKFSVISDLTESGYVGGYSNRYNGGAVDLGRTAWVYDIPNATHHKVGYYDAEHTKDNGYKISYVEDITESGYVGGYSNRYNGGAVDLGRTAWMYDIPNATHHEVGLYDVEHTKADGYQYSYFVDECVTETGYAGGYSKRYKGGNTFLGNTAWLYHVPTSRFASFDFGEDSVTGEGSSNIIYVSESGNAYGTFWHIGSNGRIDGERAFKGTIDGTKVDLFEKAGGEILNYHFEKDSIFVVPYLPASDIVIGYGQLWLDYHSTDSFLSFALLFENPIEEKAENNNQQAIANAIGGTEGSPVSYVGPYAVFFQYLLNSMSGDDASSVLQSMIPQSDSYARIVARTGMRLVMDTIVSNNFNTLGFIGGVEGNTQSKLNQSTSGFAEEDITLYGKYIYSKGSQNGDVDNNGYEFNSHGVNFGADLISGDKGILGVSIGFLETDIDGEQNTGDIDQTSFSPNIYAGFAKDKWKITAGLGYGFQKNDSTRFSGISDVGNVKADWDSHSYSVFSSAAYNLKQTKDYSLDAVVGVDYMMLHEEEYTEKAGDLWNMVIDSKTSDNLRSRLGLRVLKDNEFKNGLKLKSEVRSFWLHDYLNEASTAVNSFNGSNSFTIEGLGLDRDRLQLGFTLDLLFTDKASLFLRYDTEISENADKHEINTGLKYNF